MSRCSHAPDVVRALRPPQKNEIHLLYEIVRAPNADALVPSDSAIESAKRVIMRRVRRRRLSKARAEGSVHYA